MNEIAQTWMNKEPLFNHFLKCWKEGQQDNIRHGLHAFYRNTEYTWKEVEDAYNEIIEYFAEQY